ncbi:MAG TPA: nuclear transport factor 2 family protein [Nitrososphaeraceae archaeon]|nr:nuclear transport factor 2 family protein [Nitrososphaeraceae archaeon]
MLKTIIFGIIISLIIINPLNNSFSQSYNQTSDDAVVVVADSPEAKTNLDRFDQLDFDAWNNRNWTLFREIHSPDVLVVDFSGKVTRGIDQHVKWANESLSSTPSTIIAHPLKSAAGNWTAVTGNSTRTDLSTGESFNSTMVTVAHWKDGRILEEYLFSH